MIELRIKLARSRSFRCDVAGCRNKTRFLITKRDDVASHPLHLCGDCIRGMGVLLENIAATETGAPPLPAADGPVAEVDAASAPVPDKEEAPAEPEKPAEEPKEAEKPKKKSSGKKGGKA